MNFFFSDLKSYRVVLYNPRVGEVFPTGWWGSYWTKRGARKHAAHLNEKMSGIPGDVFRARHKDDRFHCLPDLGWGAK